MTQNEYNFKNTHRVFKFDERAIFYAGYQQPGGRFFVNEIPLFIQLFFSYDHATVNGFDLIKNAKLFYRFNFEQESTMIKKIKIVSTVKCTSCGHKEKQRMPRYAVKMYYECPKCKTIHHTLEGHCCIYCSYGSVPCPSAQQKSKRIPLYDLRYPQQIGDLGEDKNRA